MRRNIDEVLRSQNKMLERTARGTVVSDDKMRHNYELHLKRVYYRLGRNAKLPGPLPGLSCHH